MNQDELRGKIVKAWDDLSEYYQRTTQISTRDVHYGWLSHGERRLGLIGDVKGKRALEIGCGGGQNTIALARWGAEAYGMDPSERQVRFARRLADECGVDATFLVAPGEDLSQFEDEHFHLAISCYAFDYVTDLRKAYSEAFRVLKQAGTLIVCMGHPYSAATLPSLVRDNRDSNVRDYMAWPETIEWQWGPVRMCQVLRTIPQILNPMLDSGFVLETMVEQVVEDIERMSEKEKAEIPYLCQYDDEEYQISRRIPCTVIFKARK